MDPLSISVSVIGLLQSTARVFHYLCGVKNAGEDQSTLGLELIGLMYILQSLNSRLHNAQVGKPWYQGCLAMYAPDGAITELATGVHELERKLTPKTGLDRLGQKLVWPLTKSDLDKTLARVERLKSQINTLLNQDHFQLSKEILSTGKDTNQCFHTFTDRASFRKLIELLSPLNFPARQAEELSKAIEKTGQWLLESKEFELWASGNLNLLYCPGEPGTGKVFRLKEAEYRSMG